MAAPVLVITLWGMRLLTGRTVPAVWGRLLVLIAATLTLTLALAAAPPPREWPILAGLGGFAGLLLGERIAIGLALAGVPDNLETWVSLCGLILGGFGLLGLQWAAVITWHDYAATARSFGRIGTTMTEALHALANRLHGRPRPPASDKTPPRPVPAPRRWPRRETDLMPDAPLQPGADTLPGTDREGPAIIAPRPPAPPRPPQPRITPEAIVPREETDTPVTPPPLDLLAPSEPSTLLPLDEEALTQNARVLESVLSDFGVRGGIVKVRPGPVVTLYELAPAPGTKTARVVGLADDIARSMSALSARIAVVPGRNVIGIELPNSERDMVRLRGVLESPEFTAHPGSLPLALGRDISGDAVVVDLARMPHLLIAGTTGSGKSVAVNTMILSLLFRLSPQRVRLIMIDPKMLELSIYDGIPHLLTPVVTDPHKAVVALKWAAREMENRYRIMSTLGVRNIDGYNRKILEAQAKGASLTRTVQVGFDPETGKPLYEEQPIDPNPLPYIVILVDEMADLMLVAGKEVEGIIQRLAQMARAGGIHLIMATQRPSVDVITGTIKANFPTRVSFQVTSKIDSRTILGESGAEQLLGQGDMLYMAAGGRITRVHGPFVCDQEVESVCAHLRAQAEPAYLDAVLEEDEGDPVTLGSGISGEDASLYDQAVALVLRTRRPSTSAVQRHLKIGYNRAATLIERMETEGVISKPNHAGKRDVLVPAGEDDVGGALG
ncbi:DNA translocase FtsK [Pararhodospirillum photometricum]|uniref:DNA translocase FtsK n=1 Tax=Pararhodospirillum photometricum DSM 122 TaxID=1150469 RepID=H6SL41_PARPM|nr:DNA translocase FtsK [Pararhodospirillum photometricum]CCG08706.1 DNA translocase FtsK [Pararhodospirillum photometricum DSM 122]